MATISSDYQFVDMPGVEEADRPFSIHPKTNNKNLVILIHGFTGSPSTLRHLAEYLAENDLDVEVALLAGHGRTWTELKSATYHDWVKSVEEVLVKNLPNYQNIYLVGYSMGANIAMNLAVKYTQINGVVALGISIHLQQEKLARFGLLLTGNFRKRWKKRCVEDKKDGKDSQGEFLYVPIPTIKQLYKFIDEDTKKIIASVHTPLLIIHSRHDNVSRPISSEILFEEVKSKDKELFIFDKSHHSLVHKTRRDFLFSKIVDFIYKHQ